MTDDVKQVVDWSKPIEAVHEDGRVVAVKFGHDDGGLSMPISVSPKVDDDSPWDGQWFDRDGNRPQSPWRIRNVTPADTTPEWGPTIPVDGKRPEWLGDGVPTMVHWNDGDILEAKSQCIYGWDTSIHSIQVSANHPYYTRTPTIPAALVERMAGLVRALAADLTQPYDLRQVEEEARAIVVDPGFPVEVDPDLVEARGIVCQEADDGMFLDHGLEMRIALAALRRGRALARGEG